MDTEFQIKSDFLTPKLVSDLPAPGDKTKCSDSNVQGPSQPSLDKFLSQHGIFHCENPNKPATTLQGLQYNRTEAEGSIMEPTRPKPQSMPAPQPAPVPQVDETNLLPGEHKNIRVDVNELLSNGNEWLATPNTNYGGRCPQDLIGSADEHFLRETLRSAIYSGLA